MDRPLSDYDWENYSQSSGSEDQQDIEFLYGGKAQRILSSLDESIGRIDDFLSFERGYMYGDMVCSVADPSGQMGRVVNIDMLVDLESVNGETIRDVNTRELSKIRSISVGEYVILGPWLGRVTRVVDCVSILFDDGVTCEVTATDQEKLVPVSPYLLEDSQYPYYPGQRVQVRFSDASKSTRWLCSTWKANQMEGTVCGVKPGQLYVDWIASAPVGHDSKSPAPLQLQDADNLCLLSCFAHASWQLGDWCVLPMTERMKVCSNTTWHEFLKESKNLKRRVTEVFNTNFDEVYVIVKTKTKVDVLWQDGSLSLGLDSSSLLPKDVVNTHEFWSGQFVMEKGAFHEKDTSGKKKCGFVKAADAKEQTVKVKWKSFSTDGKNDIDEDWTEETVSAYELIEHPDYSYSFGDVVFRWTGSQPINHPCKGNSPEVSVSFETVLGDKNCNKEPENCYSSCIGTVIGFEDGAVEVKWAMGSTTKVAPSDIFRLDKYEVFDETVMVCEENVEQVNQDMIDHDRHSPDQKGKGLSDALCDDGQSRKCSSESCFSLPKSVIGFLSTIMGNLFGSFGYTLLPRAISSSHNCEDDDKPGARHEEGICDICTEAQPMTVEFRPVQTPELEVKAIHETRVASFSLASKTTDEFRQFDMVNHCSDHHFLDGAGKDYALTQVNRQWLRKVQHEWSILEKNLPETIYVRTYEERMDLMRAAVVGAPGTPYHDGLFFFDIYLPPGYPQEPPLVHYHSGGLRLNPNLYECGKVCLSLLNTWTGTGAEVWNPGSSTILQVLLSLQALVLNEKPYFNEAGYDSQIGKAEGEKNSVSYNENAFLVTCKSMIYLLCKPPKHFEALVEEHFRRHSQQILLACRAYMDGAPIGYAFKNSENENRKGTSTGFKIMLAKIFPKLVEAFADKGIDCRQFKP